MMTLGRPSQESYNSGTGATVYNVGLDFSTDPTSNNVFDFDGNPPASKVRAAVVVGARVKPEAGVSRAESLSIWNTHLYIVDIAVTVTTTVVAVLSFASSCATPRTR